MKSTSNVEGLTNTMFRILKGKGITKERREFLSKFMHAYAFTQFRSQSLSIES
jgi:hypothetical protein